jgi:hypothetical protein
VTNDLDALPASILAIARDIGQLPSALDAERMMSMLLGPVYAAAAPDREVALRDFVTRFRAFLRRSRKAHAPAVRAIIDALAGAPVTTRKGPAWVAHAGRVHVTGAYAYGDRYGDQTSYIATFAYDDPALGGEEHAVVILADHNLGVAKDIVVIAPAEVLISQLRDEASGPASHFPTAEDAMTWFAEIDPATARAAAEAYLACTDRAPEAPPTDSFAPNRVFAGARFALLPAREATPAGVDLRTHLMEDFLASPEADLADLTSRSGAEQESLAFCLSLIIDFGTARGDALRWSPAGVETFLTSWVHQRAIIDADDTEMLPTTLRAWVAWAGRTIDLPKAALQDTLASVRATRAEFVRLCKTGERRSPAVRAMAQLVSDGVDLDDTEAVEAWLATYQDPA